MPDVYILATASTPFRRYPDRSFQSLTRETYEALLVDGGMGDGMAIDITYFGNCAMDRFGQSNIRGQVVMDELMEEGLHRRRGAIINVEGGCATGSMAFHCAYKDILSGESDLALAMGVEKTFLPHDPGGMMALFRSGADCLREGALEAEYGKLAAENSLPFEPHPHRVIFLDTYALQAAWHMREYGTTRAQIAASAAKNHLSGSLNPKAQYRKAMSVEEILADKPVVGPFSRSMCAPVSDGAAAALLCSEGYLRGMPGAVRERAIKVRASVLAGGAHRAIDEDSLTRDAAKQAYARAGLTPTDIDVGEVHDSTSFCEIAHAEGLGLVERGKGGPAVAAGETSLGGRIPLNMSGGLVSKGHPLAATGLSMIDELALQLRGEAGARQVTGARIALQHNAGGLIGLDEAACSVILLEGRA